MNADPSLHYETIATAFQVVDIATPLRTTVLPEVILEDVWAAIMEDGLDFADTWFALVRDGQTITGHIALDTIPDTGDEQADDPKRILASQVCEPITPDQIVSANLPLLHLVPLFQQHYFFFVLSGNDLTHVVSFQNLDQLPVKLCLFALVTGFEAECMRLFSQGPIAIDTHLNRLPNNRYQKAVDACQQRHPTRERCSPPQILLATEFIDKTTMLLREPTFFAELPFRSKREAQGFFSMLQDLRNKIAHSGSILSVLSTPPAFNQLLSRLQDLTGIVSELARRTPDAGPA